MVLNVEVMNEILGIRKATTSLESEGLLLWTLKEDRKSIVDPAGKNCRLRWGSNESHTPPPPLQV
jgi:hypothetical protein